MPDVNPYEPVALEPPKLPEAKDERHSLCQFLVVSIYLLTILSGMVQLIGVETLLGRILAVSVIAAPIAFWMHVDSDIRGKPITPLIWGVFVLFWPSGTAMYLSHSRRSWGISLFTLHFFAVLFLNVFVQGLVWFIVAVASFEGPG